MPPTSDDRCLIKDSRILLFALFLAFLAPAALDTPGIPASTSTLLAPLPTLLMIAASRAIPCALEASSADLQTPWSTSHERTGTLARKPCAEDKEAHHARAALIVVLAPGASLRHLLSDLRKPLLDQHSCTM